MAKKEIEKETKKVKVDKEKTSAKKSKTVKKDTKKSVKKVKKENYFAGVKTEISKVKWPSKQEVIKYTIATVVFIVVLVIFFIFKNEGMIWNFFYDFGNYF